jgi:hypothetical protein
MVAKQVIALLAMLAMATPAHADCRHFFVKRQAVVHHAVVQQIVAPYYPPVYYSAGADIQAEALAEKVSRLVEGKLAIRQQAAQITKPATGVFAKCATCHSAASPAGGLILDGVSPITCDTYWRWGEIAGLGKDVPAKMKPLIDSMTPEQKGAINEALLGLPKAEHIVPIAPPPLPPRDGTLE